MSVYASVTGNAAVYDATTKYGPNVALTLVNTAGMTAYESLIGESITTSPTSITFPYGVTHANFVYVRNTGPASLTVTWTPSGGASNPVVTLTSSGVSGTPGGCILFMEPNLTLGVTALSLQAITNTTTCDIVIAG